MKIARLLAVVGLVMASGVFVIQAAPVESVESSRATALAKVDGFLGEQMVVDHMTAIGVTPAQARARLAKLSDSQLEELAAQVDMIHAAGTVQDAGEAWGINCVFQTLGRFIGNFFKLIFCWGQLE